MWREDLTNLEQAIISQNDIVHYNENYDTKAGKNKNKKPRMTKPKGAAGTTTKVPKVKLGK
jgi:hypothetical protein